MEKHVVLLWES